MSVAAITWAWQQRCQSAGEKLVLLALADHSSDAGYCYPGLASVAWKAGLSERQVRTHVATLEARGLLRREDRFRDDRTQTSNGYRLDLPENDTRKLASAYPEAGFLLSRKLASGSPGSGLPPNEPSVEPSVEPNPSSSSSPPPGLTTGNGKNPCAEVVELLNEATGRGFKPSTKPTQRLVKARLSEGFTVADFATVIRSRTEAWLSDPKMNQLLRPSTLFGTKFEGYLQAAKTADVSAASAYEELN